MIKFLRYGLGFFLQFFPCMLLCILPFSNVQFRFGKARTAIGLTAVVLAMAAGFPCLFQFKLNRMGTTWTSAFYEQKMTLITLANTYMGVCIVLGVVIFHFAVRTEMCKRLLVLLLALVYGMIEYITVNLSVYFLFYNPELYSVEVVLLYGVTTVVTFPFIAHFMKKRVYTYLERRDAPEIYRRLAMAVILTLLYGIFVASIGPVLEMLPDSAVIGIRLYLPYGLGYLFGTVFLCTGYWFMFWEMDNLIDQNDYKHQLSIQKLRYEAIRGDMEVVRRAKHDIRHHFRVLANFLAEDKVEEARQYLTNMDVKTDKQEAEIFCVEPVVNALLQYYIGEARSQGIDCHVKVHLDKNQVEDADMTVILGNCLENAIRACKEQPEYAFIRLKMGVVNSTLAILLENSSLEVSYRRKEKRANGFWSLNHYKEDGDGGGVGLKSVISIVEKYDGVAEFKYENGIFYSRISMEISCD